MAVGRFKLISDIGKLITRVLNSPFERGINDCNLMVLELIDLRCGTEYHKIGYGNYSTLKEGYALYQSIGMRNLTSIVEKHCEEVSTPIFGDIAMVGNSHGGIVTQTGRVLVLNSEGTEFVIGEIKELEGIRFYRPRKVKEWRSDQ